MLNKRKALAASLVALVATVPGVALAAVPEEFTDSITAALADVATMAGALVGVSAVAVAFMLAIKYVKRIPRAG